MISITFFSTLLTLLLAIGNVLGAPSGRLAPNAAAGRLVPRAAISGGTACSTKCPDNIGPNTYLSGSADGDETRECTYAEEANTHFVRCSYRLNGPLAGGDSRCPANVPVPECGPIATVVDNSPKTQFRRVVSPWKLWRAELESRRMQW